MLFNQQPEAKPCPRTRENKWFSSVMHPSMVARCRTPWMRRARVPCAALQCRFGESKNAIRTVRRGSIRTRAGRRSKGEGRKGAEFPKHRRRRMNLERRHVPHENGNYRMDSADKVPNSTDANFAKEFWIRSREPSERLLLPRRGLKGETFDAFGPGMQYEMATVEAPAVRNASYKSSEHS